MLSPQRSRAKKGDPSAGYPSIASNSSIIELIRHNILAQRDQWVRLTIEEEKQWLADGRVTAR
jgi:hypothetical protein